MIDNINLIKQFEEDLKKGECQKVELKRELSESDKLAKEIAAFSTSNKGRIYIGVSNDGDIIGISTIDNINNTLQKDDFLRKLRGIVSKVKPRVITRIDFFQYNNRIITLINVEKGSEKIYYINHIPYIRDNDESRPAEPEEVDKLYGIDETNYKELAKREVNQIAIHIFGYLKYPDPYELIQIINKYEKEYDKYRGLYVHMFSKTFNVVDYPLSDEQSKYLLAKYVHNKNNNYKKILVTKGNSFKYDKNDIIEILGDWDDYSQSKDSENFIYFLDNTPMPYKATFILKNNIFQHGDLELIEAIIIYEDFTYFVEVTKKLLKEKLGKCL